MKPKIDSLRTRQLTNLIQRKNTRVQIVYFYRKRFFNRKNIPKNRVITVTHGIRHYFIPFVHCIWSGCIIDSSPLFSLCQVTTKRCTTDNNSSSWQRVKFNPWAKDPLQKALKTYDAQAACKGNELSLAREPVTPSKIAHYVQCF